MFSLPCGDDEVEGKSDKNPIYLSGVTVLEFGSLLQYLFKGVHDDFYLPQSSWIALLSIARRYGFQDVFKRAIREIYDGPATKTRNRRRSYSELGDPIFLVSIAEQYDVPPRHIVPHLVALVMREEALTEAEIMLLSPLAASQLGRAREDFLRKAWRSQTLEWSYTYERSHAHQRSWWGPATSGSPDIVAMEIVRNIWPEVEE